jgi:dynein heavy chain
MTFGDLSSAGYDGDVDALWVENMNSVMDDNKLLTLPNGERIRLQPFAAMLFEVGDLQYASPATVSRAGMVWVDPKNLGYRPFFERWLKTTIKDNPERLARLEELFSKYIPEILEWLMMGLIFDEYQTTPKMVLPQSDLNLVVALSHLLTSCFQQAPACETKHLEGIFLACLTWSLGASLIQSEHRRFDANLKRLSGMPGSDAATVPGSSLPGQTKFSIFVKIIKVGSWSCLPCRMSKG